MRAIYAIALSQADIIELLLREESLKLRESASELRGRLGEIGFADLLILSAGRQRLQRRKTGIECKQTRIIARRAKIGVELGAHVEERLVGEGALHQRSCAR